MMTLDPREVARALGGDVHSNGQVLCPGPGHSQEDRSLSIRLDPKAPEGFVVHPFANDSVAACRDYVRSRLGLPPFETRKPDKGGGGGKRRSLIVAEYVYRTADGAPYLLVRRTADKKFFQSHREGDTWVKGKPRGPKVPYRLPELLAASSNTPVYVVEGEKDADGLAALGLVATCNSEGADGGKKKGKKWAPELNQHFAARPVIVVPDNDGPGAEHAQYVARSLAPVAASVRIVELPGLEPGGDASDWLAAGGNTEKLGALAAVAPEWKPTAGVGQSSDHGSVDENAEIARLAKLTSAQYERERKAAAQRLGFRATILDRLVQAERPNRDSKQGRALSFAESEPWPEPVSGQDLLDSIADLIRRHVVVPEHSDDVAALWIVHTYVMDLWEITPRLAIGSPTKQCGKSTLIDVIGRLVFRCLSTEGVTTAAIFRTIEACRPTLLMDEADTYVHNNEDMRGVLNSGHRRNGSVIRTVGEDYEPRKFATYCACAFGLIGRLPDTLHDRSIIISLKRRLPTEPIQPFRRDRADHVDALARKIVRWTTDHAKEIGSVDPEMPLTIYNRQADNWRALLAIADVAGGHWPARARKAAELSCEDAASDDSRLMVLLADIRTIFDERKADRLVSAHLVEALAAIEGRPWAEYGRTGKSITVNQLAALLRPLTIVPENVRFGEKVLKGYLLSRFKEAFARYLGEGPHSEPLHRYNGHETGTSSTSQGATEEPHVAAQDYKKPNNDADCSGVADQKEGAGESLHAKHVCAQCGSGPDGKERPYRPNGRIVWLHPECFRFYHANGADTTDEPVAFGENNPSEVGLDDAPGWTN
jgi:hypothetical protein